MRKNPVHSRSVASTPVLVVGASVSDGPFLADGCGFSATSCLDAGDALEMLRQGLHQVVLCDLDTHGSDGMVLLKAVCADFPQVAVVAVTRPGKLRNGILAMIAGASGYIQTPVQSDTVVTSLRSALRRKRLDSAVQGRTTPLQGRLGRLD